jgi:hypothetical protein
MMDYGSFALGKPLTPAQFRALRKLAEHPGEFRRGYGKSAFALARRGLAKIKHVSDDGEHFTAKFVITRRGEELLAASTQS